MAQRVRDILLRIRGDASDAEQDLHQLARELKQFDGITAEATVDINTAAAERKVKSAKDAVQAFGRMSEEAKVDLQARAAQVKLDGLNRNLDNLQKREVTPKIEIAIGKTVAQIERVEAQLDKLDRRRVDIDIDVDRHGRGAGLIGRGIGAGTTAVSAAARGFGAFVTGAAAATEAFGAFVTTVSRGFGVIGGLANLFIQFGITGLAMAGTFAQMGAAALVLLPILVVLTVVIGTALVTAVAHLAGAVVALGASFIVAAAGVGVLGIALAAAFGPVLLVAIAAMARFAKILEAVKSREDDVAEGARAVRDANQAQAQAQRNAVDAAQRVRTTAVDAYRAWRDAAEETSDAIRGITDAELSRERAQLTLKQAKQDLADFRRDAGLTDKSLDSMFKKFTDISFRPKDLIGAIQKSEAGQRAGVDPLELADKVLRVREAQQGVVTATDGVSDAVTRANDARERENEFLEKGIQAYEPYTAAVQAQEDAQRALADATDATAEAREKQNEKLKDLTPQERRLVDVLVKLKDTLTDVFRPATRAIFEGLLDLLEDIGDFAKDSGVRRGFRLIGEAIGGLFRGLGRELRRKETRDAFATFARNGAAIIRELTPVFRTLTRLILRVAEAASPWLLNIIRDIGRAFRRWAGDIDRSDVEDFVHRVQRSFRVWKRIAEDLWAIIKEFFGDAADSGDKLGDKIHRILVDFREWLEKNPDAIKKFFKDSANFASDLADAMKDVKETLEWMINAKNDIKDVFTFVSGGNLGTQAEAADKDVQGVTNLKIAIDQASTTEEKRRLKRVLLQLYGVRYKWALGGLVPGLGTGDTVPSMLEPGEYVIRRSVTQAIGVNRLNLLNTGNINALTGGGRGGVHIENINLPPAPGHGQLGDPRHQAVQLARELRRRGEIGIGGGGFP